MSLFIKHFLFICLACFSMCFLAAAQDKTIPKRVATFADGNLYAANGTFDGSLAHRRTSLSTDINPWLSQAKAAGQFTLVQVEGGKGLKKGDSDALDALGKWLDRTDLARVDAICFFEENAHDAQMWLDPLYDIVKEKGDVPVYVWYSQPLAPFGAKADGYVYDFYGPGYRESRSIIEKYLSTGKPLILCIDASLYSDLESAREQFMICREYNLPVMYFGCENPSGSPNNWYGGKENAANLTAARNLVFSGLNFQNLSRKALPQETADFLWGPVIPMTFIDGRNVEIQWTGIGGASVYSRRELAVRDGSVSLAGSQPASLDYQFWSYLPLQNPVFTLDIGNGNVPKVEISRSGREGDWRELSPERTKEHVAFALGKDLREFRVRITLADQSTHFSAASLTATADSGHVIALNPEFFNGWVKRFQYKEKLASGQWRALASIDHPDAIQPGEGLSLRGAKGKAVAVEVVQKFTSSRPLKDIVVHLTGSVSPSLGGSFSLGISRDGLKILAESQPAPPAPGTSPKCVILTANTDKIPELQKISEFYVHLRQANSSGIRSRISSRLDTLEVEASPMD